MDFDKIIPDLGNPRARQASKMGKHGGVIEQILGQAPRQAPKQGVPPPKLSR